MTENLELKLSRGFSGLRVAATPNATASGNATALTYTQTRTAGFGSEVKKRLLLGTYALIAE